MSPSVMAALIPEWFRTWIRYQLIPALGFQPQQLAVGVLRGAFDTLLLVFLGLGFLTGGRLYMNGEYALPRQVQSDVLKWAPVADHIARKADVPREVPLVLWFKENSMRSENPENCTGIIGAYDLVRSGEAPCFTPGPVSDIEVSQQLTIAVTEFKERCPEISYWTQSPELIKKCYFAYNAGAGAAARLDANQSAYVMNNYSASYQNMVYSDVELGTVQVTALGAWPTHLAMQSLIVSQMDVEERPFSLALVDMSTRLYDWVAGTTLGWGFGSFDDRTKLIFPGERSLAYETCLESPHLLGNPRLRPRLNPVSEDPVLTQDVHGCSYSLPGIDITSSNRRAILRAPMEGNVTTYTDVWQNTTIRIENDEWVVWLLHPRSYLVEEGKVTRGQPVGVMGSVGYSTGPHVHYTVYDKIREQFVDPSLFVP